MNFEEWHDKQLNGDPDTCPHKDWERFAWDAALEEAAKVVEQNGAWYGKAYAKNIRRLIAGEAT